MQAKRTGSTCGAANATAGRKRLYARRTCRAVRQKAAAACRKSSFWKISSSARVRPLPFWKLADGAHGVSIGKTLPTYPTEVSVVYPKEDFTVENAAKIPCRQVLGTYTVRFER